MSLYQIVPIDRTQSEAIEYLGTKRKFWFTGADGRRMLFKAEERGTGEDWAEKIACELAGLIGLPHVHYELAEETETQIPGVVCASCLEAGEALAHGNQLLLETDPSYSPDQRRFKVAAHSVGAVAAVLSKIGPPDAQWMADVPEGVVSALDVFAGYLMLDAWVANQDRHHENWAAIRRPGSLTLAPSFDHGASLARNLSDEERHERLTSRDQNRQVLAFARRARSALHGDPASQRPLTTIAAWHAVRADAPGAAIAWTERLRATDEAVVRNVLDRVPPDRLSALGREFTLSLLMVNRTRILNGETV